MALKIKVAAVALALALGACDSSTEPCRAESLQVRMPATVVRDGQSVTTELSYEAQIGLFSSIAAFEATRTFLTGNAAQYSGSIACSFESSIVGLTLELQGPRQAGDVLQLSTGVFANWGPLAPPNGAVAAAAVSAANFAAQANDGSVSGTVEVLGIAPLRLRLDLLATSATGDEIRIRGDMTAQLLGNALGCD